MRKMEGDRFLPSEQDEDYGAGAIHLMGLYSGGNISYLIWSHDGPWLDDEDMAFAMTHTWKSKDNFLEYTWDKDRELEMDEVMDANQKLIPMLFDQIEHYEAFIDFIWSCSEGG